MRKTRIRMEPLLIPKGRIRDEEEKYVLCTMPYKQGSSGCRHGLCQTVYEETSSQLDTVNAAYTAKINKLLINAQKRGAG